MDIKKLDLDFTEASTSNIVLIDKANVEQSICVDNLKKGLMKNLKLASKSLLKYFYITNFAI